MSVYAHMLMDDFNWQSPGAESPQSKTLGDSGTPSLRNGLNQAKTAQPDPHQISTMFARIVSFTSENGTTRSTSDLHNSLSNLFISNAMDTRDARVTGTSTAAPPPHGSQAICSTKTVKLCPGRNQKMVSSKTMLNSVLRGDREA